MYPGLELPMKIRIFLGLFLMCLSGCATGSSSSYTEAVSFSGTDCRTFFGPTAYTALTREGRYVCKTPILSAELTNLASKNNRELSLAASHSRKVDPHLTELRESEYARVYENQTEVKCQKGLKPELNWLTGDNFCVSEMFDNPCLVASRKANKKLVLSKMGEKNEVCK
jgi:hypothetical protein